MRYSARFDEIKDARRGEDEHTLDPWSRGLKTADWPLTIALTQETLASQTKDLWLVAWLSEAMLRAEGLSGFRETLDLARALLN
jgi:type VI secretion system protein ImpA